ncbi:MAG: hypothetical protein A2Z72_08330 [Omnitrophica bacterium RBG_13_46_9]|nr:MAG: hypothetical protein A2Z72_08330 [Omnitrophica bacterium RBG_13_46_9]
MIKKRTANTWFKELSLGGSTGRDYCETWFSRDHLGKSGQRYKVDVRAGKTTDILSFKSNTAENFNSQVSHIKSTRKALFNSGKKNRVKRCPICGASSGNSKHRLDIYGARYHQCSTCGHLFVINRPKEPDLKKFYSRNISYASTYTDKRMLKMRIEQVVAPKLKWVLETYRALYKRRPRTILDVGAGGGHFVHASRQLGLDACGVEVNEASREFCKKNFGFNLETLDFTKNWRKFPDVDIVTFWGVIEHVADPVSLLKTAYRVLSGRQGLLVVEVPRWDSFSTAIQHNFPNSIIRHLDPLGHINCFTDSSLLTAFENSNFAPVAAWYFGMDIYELTMQFSHLLKDKKIIDMLSKHMNSFQKMIDNGRLSDGMVLAGKAKNG